MHGRRRIARSSTARIRLVPTTTVWEALCATMRASHTVTVTASLPPGCGGSAPDQCPLSRAQLPTHARHFRAGYFALPPHALHTWLAAASCRACPGGSRACHPAPFRAGPIEPLLRRCAPGLPVRLTLRFTRWCKSPPTPPGSSAPPAPCRAGVRESAVQPLRNGCSPARSGHSF